MFSFRTLWLIICRLNEKPKPSMKDPQIFVFTSNIHESCGREGMNISYTKTRWKRLIFGRISRVKLHHVARHVLIIIHYILLILLFVLPTSPTSELLSQFRFITDMKKENCWDDSSHLQPPKIRYNFALCNFDNSGLQGGC